MNPMAGWRKPCSPFTRTRLTTEAADKPEHPRGSLLWFQFHQPTVQEPTQVVQRGKEDAHCISAVGKMLPLCLYFNEFRLFVCFNPHQTTFCIYLHTEQDGEREEGTETLM